MLLTISIIVATYGNDKYKRLAERRAAPSAYGQAAHEVILYHDPAGPLAAARNAAAHAATGEWLCFLDADDELAPGYIDAMRRVARQQHRTLLIPAVEFVRDGGYTAPAAIPNGGGNRPLHEINSAVIGTLVPRSLFIEVGGFDARWPIYEDWALWLACVRAGANLVNVPAAVYRAFQTPRSRNQSKNEQRVTYWAIRREHEILTRIHA